MIELPEYKAPNAYSIAIYVWEKVKDYITRAGTIIFVASIIMWVLLNCGPHGLAEDMGQSFGAIMGKVLVPIFTPIGLGYWQIVVALISGIAAKEVVVSSCSVLFGINNINSQAGMDDLVGMLAVMGFWRSQCLCVDDLLPALYTLYRYAGYHQAGVRQLEMDRTGYGVSVSGGMGCYLCHLPYWDAVCIRRPLCWQQSC